MIGGPVVERSCPLCGSGSREHLAWLRPEQFCEGNPTYRKDVRALLHLASDDRFPITRCFSCGHVYSGHLPGRDFLEAVYEQVILLDACVSVSEAGSEMARRARYVREFLMLRSGPRLKALDFGCGSGPTTSLLDATGIQALGFEASMGRLRRSAARRHVTGSWQEVLARAPYDFVVCDNVLEHLPDPRGTVKELAALLEPGSVLFVSVPDYSEPFLSRRLNAAQAGGAVDTTLNPWEHLSYFSLRCLDALMRGSGLRRLRSCELANPPELGLRAEPRPSRRVLNALATSRRLIRYALTGRGVETTEHSFYVKT